MDLPSPIPSYKMGNSRGLCLIFVNINFSPDLNLSSRDGAIHDKQRLESSFSRLGFEVRVYINCSVYRITQNLRAVSKEDHRNRDCLVCCFSTHGGDGLYATDSIFSTQLIYRYFSDNKCPSLALKPKIFIIQACQGTKVDRGTMYQISMDTTDGASHVRTSCSDVITAVATAADYVAWRNSGTGSYFIKCLSEALDEYGNTMDFLNLLTLVNYRMTCVNISNEKYMQMPYYSSSLTKKLYFPILQGDINPTIFQNFLESEDLSNTAPHGSG